MGRFSDGAGREATTRKALTLKASDALPLPLYLTNAIFFTLFFSVVYYLFRRWRDKIQNSTPRHIVTLSEIVAIMSLVVSFIYLLGFFDIDFIQSFIARASHDVWDLEDDAGDMLLLSLAFTTTTLAMILSSSNWFLD